jgi:hypothetical protein
VRQVGYLLELEAPLFVYISKRFLSFLPVSLFSEFILSFFRVSRLKYRIDYYSSYETLLHEPPISASSIFSP